jgi:2,4-dienoyl-CoA reductase-like NADH-dependent reductase (Old Yellow Enzyme family)
LTTLAADLQAAISPMLADPHFPALLEADQGRHLIGFEQRREVRVGEHRGDGRLQVCCQGSQSSAMHSRFQAALTTLAADLQAAISPMLADPHFPALLEATV